MKRILFSNGNSGAKGTLGPTSRMLAIAAAITQAEPDARILFRVGGNERENLESRGYVIAEGFEPTLFGLPRFIDRMINRSMERKPGRPIPPVRDMQFVLKLKGMLSPRYLEKTLAEELRLLEEWQPTCVYGSMELLMPMATRKLGIPYVPIGSAVMRSDYHSPLFPGHRSWSHAEIVNPLLKKTGLPPVRTVTELLFEYNAAKILVPSIPELEDLPADDRIVYTGSLLGNTADGCDFSWQKKKPLVYVYLSVGQITPAFYMEVLERAFTESGLDVIVAAGDHPYFKGRKISPLAAFISAATSRRTLYCGSVTSLFTMADRTAPCRPLQREFQLLSSQGFTSSATSMHRRPNRLGAPEFWQTRISTTRPSYGKPSGQWKTMK